MFCKKYWNENLEFIHIRAHTGLKDKHSIGNDNADRLANLAIGVTSCPYANIKKKLYYLAALEMIKSRWYHQTPKRVERLIEILLENNVRRKRKSR